MFLEGLQITCLVEFSMCIGHYIKKSTHYSRKYSDSVMQLLCLIKCTQYNFQHMQSNRSAWAHGKMYLESESVCGLRLRLG